jgi:uncharacterized membrane protein HdeD (DUF308 family)
MEDKMSETNPMPMCPMAKACRGMTEKPFAGLILLIPGVVLIVLAVLIVIEPKILVWLVAALFVLLGVMMLTMANFIRKLGAGMHHD